MKYPKYQFVPHPLNDVIVLNKIQQKRSQAEIVFHNSMNLRFKILYYFVLFPHWKWSFYRKYLTIRYLWISTVVLYTYFLVFWSLFICIARNVMYWTQINLEGPITHDASKSENALKACSVTSLLEVHAENRLVHASQAELWYFCDFHIIVTFGLPTLIDPIR